MTLPSLPMLAVLIRGVVTVAGVLVVSRGSKLARPCSCDSVTAGCITPDLVSAISFTSREESTSPNPDALVCRSMVVGPWNRKNS